MAREALITQEGLEKLKTEIEHLSTTKRREVAQIQTILRGRELGLEAQGQKSKASSAASKES